MEFRILGPMEVAEGDRLVALGAGRQRVLLALLLLHANQVVPGERLIDAMWGEAAPSTASKRLRVYVSELRRALRDADAGADEVLLTRAGGYVLRLAPGALDADRFARLVEDGRRAAGHDQPEQAARMLRAALSLWRGHALMEFRDDAFARADVARLEELRLAALEDRVEADLALGRHRELVGELESMVTEHPRRERLRGQLIVALSRCDRRSDAVDVYRQGQRLSEALGLQPGPALQRLEREILVRSARLAALDEGAGSSVEPPLLSEREAGAGRLPLPGGLRLVAALPFVGRSNELAALERLYGEAARDGRRLALIGGEPGAGKTRLARELAKRVERRGACVLYGTCDAAVPSPYRPFVEVLEHVVDHIEPAALERAVGACGGELKRLVPDLARRLPGLPEPPASDPDTERHRLHSAVVNLLGGLGREAGVVLVLDDLHWADAPTLLLLRHLAKSAADVRVLVIGLYREGDGEHGHPLAAALAELRRLDGVTWVQLAGLAPGEIAEFLHRLTDTPPSAKPTELAEALSEVTGGNPFLVGELCRHLSERGASTAADASRAPARVLEEAGVPASVREAVGQRLARLAPATRDVLELASVSARASDIRVLRAAASLNDSALERALEEGVRSGMLDELPGPRITYRFRHELLRRAVHDRVTAVRRASLHLRTGEALERVHQTDLERVVSDLAFHFAAAAAVMETDRAVEYALRAAHAATRTLAFQDAARHLRTALALGLPDPRRRALTHCELGTTLHLAGHAPEALESFADGARLARELGDAALFARAALGFETACWSPGIDDPRAVELLQEAARTVGDEAPMRVRLLAQLSRALAYRGDHAAAGVCWSDAVELARAIDDRPGLVVALFHAAWIRGSRTLADVLASLKEARQLATAPGDEELRSEGHGFLVSALIESYAIDEARRELADWQAAVERAGQLLYLHNALCIGSAIAVCGGRFELAEAITKQAQELSRQLGHGPTAAYGIQMFTIRREQGRLAEIAALLRVIAAEDHGASGIWRPALAVLLAELGELSAARRELERVSADDFAHKSRGGLWLAAHTYLADACSAVEDVTLARRLYRHLLPFEGQNVMIGHALACYGATDRYLGALATTMGDWNAAELHFQAALELNSRLQSPTWLAHTRYEYARLLTRRRRPGDAHRAQALAADALASARRIGMSALAQRIQDMGAQPRPPALPDGLSARELDVLRLIARGRTNREIGRALYISEHTAANHVRSILMKTGCRNRTKAAAYAHGHGLVEQPLRPANPEE